MRDNREVTRTLVLPLLQLEPLPMAWCFSRSRIIVGRSWS
jgi:hypothetical protein